MRGFNRGFGQNLPLNRGRGFGQNKEFALQDRDFDHTAPQGLGRRAPLGRGLGAGLGRGDWSIISDIIDNELKGEDHTLVEYLRI